MSQGKVVFKNKNSGQIRNVPIGLSWTALFFGFIPAVIRSDWKAAIIIFFCDGLACGLSVPFFTIGLALLGFSNYRAAINHFIFSYIILQLPQIYLFFRYNGHYMKTLLKDGFIPEYNGNNQSIITVLNNIEDYFKASQTDQINRMMSKK